MFVGELLSCLLVHEQKMNDHNSPEEQVLKLTQDEFGCERGGFQNEFDWGRGSEGRLSRQGNSGMLLLSWVWTFSIWIPKETIWKHCKLCSDQ